MMNSPKSMMSNPKSMMNSPKSMMNSPKNINKITSSYINSPKHNIK